MRKYIKHFIVIAFLLFGAIINPYFFPKAESDVTFSSTYTSETAYEYNDEGNVVKETILEKYYEIREEEYVLLASNEISVAEYNDDGQLIHMKNGTYEDFYTYEDGYLVLRKSYYNGELVDREEHTYEMDQDTIRVEKVTTIYGSNPLRIEYILYEYEGDLLISKKRIDEHMYQKIKK